VFKRPGPPEGNLDLVSALAPQAQYPSFKFDTLGAEFKGIITQPPQDSQAKKYGTNDLDFWPDGQPKIQTRIVARLADGQEHAIYALGRMARSITTAIVGAGASDVEIGAEISVKWASGEGKTGSPKLFESSYVPPTGGPDDEEPPF
jgi:hypothetical protein